MKENNFCGISSEEENFLCVISGIIFFQDLQQTKSDAKETIKFFASLMFFILDDVINVP